MKLINIQSRGRATARRAIVRTIGRKDRVFEYIAGFFAFLRINIQQTLKNLIENLLIAPP